MQKMLTLTTACFAKPFFGKRGQSAASIMNKAETKKLIQKLENAYVCCNDCGLKWGVYSVECSSIWMDVCQVCDTKKPVTVTRDY